MSTKGAGQTNKQYYSRYSLGTKTTTYIPYLRPLLNNYIFTGQRLKKSPTMASLISCLTVLTLTLSSLTVAEPPGVPSAATARTELASLTVAAQGSSDGYSRSKFPHWITISGTCNTRETVLKRDGTDVVVGSDCYPTSGTWVSPYDGATWTAPSDLDIDHLVPLSNAWKSGASSWTTAQRQTFANDLDHPQLLAVTDNVGLPT